MVKRGLTIGTYDTAATGRWTLTGWEFSPAEQYTNFVDVPGRKKGPLDLSTALTDGDPYYRNRTLTATFESSEGNRLDREARINTMINSLDGYTHEITLPDDREHHIVGRVHIQRLYNDSAHASVVLTAVCEPWRYNNTPTRVELVAEATAKITTLPNLGRMAAAPVLTVTGTEAVIEYGGSSWALSPGTYTVHTVPDLFIPAGGLTIKYRGAGGLIFDYREAVL